MSIRAIGVRLQVEPELACGFSIEGIPAYSVAACGETL
jgi:hypothetical protein